MVDCVCDATNKLRIEFLQLMFFLVLFVLTAGAELYEASLKSNYSLGSNLLVNPSFTSPTLPAGSGVSYYASILGWKCGLECQVQNVIMQCKSRSINCITSWKQGLDMDPRRTFTVLSQNVSIQKQSLYLLHIEWLPPFVNPIGKSLGIHINSSVFFNFTVTSQSFSAHVEQFIINATPGTMNLRISMFGTVPDGAGILVSGFRLQQLIPILNSSTKPDVGLLFFINLIFANNLTDLINKIPGNRILSYSFMNFFSTFDRLQLYYFHRHNLSQNAFILLSTIQNFQMQQGYIAQSLFQQFENDSSVCSSINGLYDSLFKSFDNQYAYSDAHFLSRNPNGVGFFSNNLDFFFYKLPTLLLIYLGLYLAFRAFFNLRVSVYLRKYSFPAILLLMIYEGNMEQFSFYFFQETKKLFSRDIFQKLSKILMVYFMWIAVVFGVGGLLYLKFHYGRLVKYFTEEYKMIRIDLLILETLEKSTFPLLFGCIHALLLDSLELQTIVLFCVEVAYYIVKLLNLRALAVKFKLKVVLLSVTSLLRMSFIVTFYLFEALSGPAVINEIHRELIWLYLLCWAVELVYDISNLVFEGIEHILKSYRSNSSIQQNNLNIKKELIQGGEKAAVKQPSKQKQQNVIRSRHPHLRKKAENKSNQANFYPDQSPI